jgi:molecular chaperone GrpE
MANNKKWGDIFGKSKNDKQENQNESENQKNDNDNLKENSSEIEEGGINLKDEEIKNIQKTLAESQDREKKLLYVIAEKENQINLLRQDMIFEKESFSIKFIKAISKELDDLFRIMQAITEKNKDDPMTHALKVNCDKFISALEKINVKVILPKIGDEFDDKFHNAITQIKSEEYDNGKIAQVASGCYLLGDKVISHAMVVVVNNN